MTSMIDRRGLLAGLSLAALPAALWAPTKVWARTAADYPNLKAFLDSYITSKKLPGMSIAIKRAGDPVQYISGGTVAFDSDVKVTPESIFRIYSMTKPITGLAVMKLIEDGKLTLETPVADIIPEFKTMTVVTDLKTMTTAPATRVMKIRHLLTHSSGLSYGIFRDPLAALYTKNGITPGSREKTRQPGEDVDPITSLEDMVQRLAKLPLSFEPGTRWQYSVAFDVLGLVIKRVSGMGFYEYLRKSFFVPLKMNDTDFVVARDKANRFTTEIAVKNGQRVTADDRATSAFLLDRDLPSGGGGLTSTAHDYARFVSMLLNEGELDGVRVVKTETARIARSNLLEPGVFFLGFGGGLKNGYGAGVAVVLPGGERPGEEPAGSFWWFGIAGTQFWVDPLNKFSVVCMLNEYPTTDPVQREVRLAAYRDFGPEAKGVIPVPAPKAA
jgi:CubicO group peptidase (beta-lactamase class C family)